MKFLCVQNIGQLNCAVYDTMTVSSLATRIKPHWTLAFSIRKALHIVNVASLSKLWAV